jgi:Contractile injection system tube protein
MERVAFLVEHTGERIACLLNPESLVMRRLAGVRVRQSVGGLVTGAELEDDPLFFSGGGSTDVTLNLLFDVNIGGSKVAATDVRELTGPIWRLAENARSSVGGGRPPAVRLIWGKSFNIRGVVAAIAERLEYFTADGVPRRSWLRMRLLRSVEGEAEAYAGKLDPPLVPEDPTEPPPELPDGPLLVHAVAGGEGDEAPEPGLGERLDQIAFRYYGDASQWRALAWLNNIADPLAMAAGQVLQVATRTDVEGDSE